VKATTGQNVLEVDRPARFARFHDEEARVALARLQDELALEVRTGLDLVMQEVQGERLGGPARRQFAAGRIRYERKDEKGIEGRPELTRLGDVVGNRIPAEELLPRLTEELVAELVGRVGNERRYQDAFGSAKADPGGVFGVEAPKTAVLELAAAAARARGVAAG
jgi:hypothetical protein